MALRDLQARIVACRRCPRLVRFREAVADDLDLPQALVALNETVTAPIAGGEKVNLLTSWDALLGLDLGRLARETFEPSEEALGLIAERDLARAAKDFARSDEIRDRLQAMGLEVMDTPEGTKVHAWQVSRFTQKPWQIAPPAIPGPISIRFRS